MPLKIFQNFNHFRAKINLESTFFTSKKLFQELKLNSKKIVDLIFRRKYSINSKSQQWKTKKEKNISRKGENQSALSIKKNSLLGKRVKEPFENFVFLLEEKIREKYFNLLFSPKFGTVFSLLFDLP